MLRLADLAEDRRTITVAVQTSTQSFDVQLTYRPSVFTPSFWRSFATLPIEEFVVAVVETWEVEDLDPASLDDVGRLPTSVLSQIFDAVTADLRVGKANGATSRAGSPRTARRANRSAST